MITQTNTKWNVSRFLPHKQLDLMGNKKQHKMMIEIMMINMMILLMILLMIMSRWIRVYQLCHRQIEIDHCHRHHCFHLDRFISWLISHHLNWVFTDINMTLLIWWPFCWLIDVIWLIIWLIINLETTVWLS